MMSQVRKSLGVSLSERLSSLTMETGLTYTFCAVVGSGRTQRFEAHAQRYLSSWLTSVHDVRHILATVSVWQQCSYGCILRRFREQEQDRWRVEDCPICCILRSLMKHHLIISLQWGIKILLPGCLLVVDPQRKPWSGKYWRSENHCL